MPKLTGTQCKRQQEKAKQKYIEKRKNESDEGKSQRLLKRRKLIDSETESQRKERLCKQQKRDELARAMETEEEKVSRLANQKKRVILARAIETDEKRVSRLAKEKERAALARAIESDEKKSSRLAKMKERYALKKANETADEKIARNEKAKIRMSVKRQNQTSDERAETNKKRRLNYKNRVDPTQEFKATINSFCVYVCYVCRKECYANQKVDYKMTSATCYYIPPEVANKKKLTLCHRCHTWLTNERNVTNPPKAKLDPGKTPQELEDLPEPEL